MIPYGKQDISQSDIDSVVSVLKSDFLTQGPQVPLFEKTVAEYCEAEYGVAVNSALEDAKDVSAKKLKAVTGGLTDGLPGF